jgi:hypothetical protein
MLRLKHNLFENNATGSQWLASRKYCPYERTQVFG